MTDSLCGVTWGLLVVVILAIAAMLIIKSGRDQAVLIERQ